MKWKTERKYRKHRKHQNQKSQQNQLLGELWWLLKKFFCFVFPTDKLVVQRKTNFSLGKSCFLEVVGSKSKLFPKEKVGFCNAWP